MLKKKNISRILIFFFILAISVTSVSAISETKQKLIIKNCKRIRETLKGIQRSDTSARTDYLPSIYDEMLSNFIIPMNSRLLKNGESDTVLLKIQEDFAETYKNFKSDFVTYSRSMEKLLGINCEERPEEFYSTLEIVRTDREYVNLDIKKLNQYISQQKSQIEKIRNENE